MRVIKRYFFLTFLATASGYLFAHDWLQPIPTCEKDRFVLENFQFLPYRFLYKGFVSEGTRTRYVFQSENARMVSMFLGETVEDITILEVDQSYQTLTVRDRALNQTLVLKLGKITFLQDRFKGTLLYKGQRYEFSEQPLHIDAQTMLTPMLHEENLYLIEQTQGQEPYIGRLCKLQP